MAPLPLVEAEYPAFTAQLLLAATWASFWSLWNGRVASKASPKWKHSDSLERYFTMYLQHSKKDITGGKRAQGEAVFTRFHPVEARRDLPAPKFLAYRGLVIPVGVQVPTPAPSCVAAANAFAAGLLPPGSTALRQGALVFAAPSAPAPAQTPIAGPALPVNVAPGPIPPPGRPQHQAGAHLAPA
ncbi:hypothetical protein JCM9279_005489, partial [Rhodotorula babjevae]